MAYMDFSAAALAGLPGGTAPAAGEPARFSALEWLVVALAERDRVASLRQPGRIAAALARLFGGNGPARLADPRLEALRRFAVYAWAHGHNLPRSERNAFGLAGFTPDQAEALIESVVGRRAERRRRAA